MTYTKSKEVIVRKYMNRYYRHFGIHRAWRWFSGKNSKLSSFRKLILSCSIALTTGLLLCGFSLTYSFFTSLTAATVCTVALYDIYAPGRP